MTYEDVRRLYMPDGDVIGWLIDSVEPEQEDDIERRNRKIDRLILSKAKRFTGMLAEAFSKRNMDIDPSSLQAAQRLYQIFLTANTTEELGECIAVTCHSNGILRFSAMLSDLEFDHLPPYFFLLNKPDLDMEWSSCWSFVLEQKGTIKIFPTIYKEKAFNIVVADFSIKLHER